MSKTLDGYKITANRTPYRRAGLDLSEPLLIAKHALTDAQLDTLRADPIVHVAEEQFTDEAAPLPTTLPTKKAELQALLTENGVEYAEADTVAQLTERAKAQLSVAG